MSALPNPLTMTDWHSGALAIPVEVDPRDRRLAELEGQIEDLEEQLDKAQRDAAKCRVLLKQLSQVQAKPAKADMLIDDPTELMIVGQATALETVRIKCALFLREAR